MTKRFYPFIGAGAVLICLCAAALVWAVTRSGESFALTDEQVQSLDLAHWTPMERWAFAEMREEPGQEIVFADFRGDGPGTITARFINDALRLTPSLDGSGLKAINFNGVAIAGDLALDGETLDSLRLVGATIGGKLSLANVTIADRGEPFGQIDGQRLNGELVLWNVTVAGIADFANVVARDISITGMEGAEFVMLSGAKAQTLTMAESFGFELLVILRATIQDALVLRDVDLASDLVLQGTSAGSISFEGLKIGGQLDGVGMVVDRDFLIANTDVEQEFIVTSAMIGGDFIADQTVSARSALTEATVGGETRVNIVRR